MTGKRERRKKSQYKRRILKLQQKLYKLFMFSFFQNTLNEFNREVSLYTKAQLHTSHTETHVTILLVHLFVTDCCHSSLLENTDRIISAEMYLDLFHMHNIPVRRCNKYIFKKAALTDRFL